MTKLYEFQAAYPHQVRDDGPRQHFECRAVTLAVWHDPKLPRPYYAEVMGGQFDGLSAPIYSAAWPGISVALGDPDNGQGIIHELMQAAKQAFAATQKNEKNP